MQDFTVGIQTACWDNPALAMFRMYVLESASKNLWKMVSKNTSLFFKFYYWFCRLDCHFLSIDAGCDGCHAWGRQRLLNLEHLVVLSAGPIPHNSIHLLIITADFVPL